VIGAVISVPLVLRVPDQLPEAVQLVALVLDQVSVLVVPFITVVGLAVMVTVGIDGAMASPRPELPLQPAARIPINSAPAVRSTFQECCFMGVLSGFTRHGPFEGAAAAQHRFATMLRGQEITTERFFLLRTPFGQLAPRQARGGPKAVGSHDGKPLRTTHCPASQRVRRETVLFTPHRRPPIAARDGRIL
jgi:hypothetical protein